MKKLNVGDKLKKIIALIMIICMNFSYILPFTTVKATNSNTYVEFDANWADNNSKTIATESNIYVISNFTIKLNTVSTGFQNLKLYALDVATEGKENYIASLQISDIDTTYIKNTTYNMVEFKDNLTAGTSISGTVSAYFQRDINFETYSKTIKLKLTGEYIDPETKKTVKIEEEIPTSEIELKAEVSPSAAVTNFTQNMKLESNGIVSQDRTELYNDTGVKIGFKVSKFTHQYLLNIDLQTYIQSSKLVLTINKVSTLEDGIERDYEIDLSELIEDFGEPQSSENEDGSINYAFTLGNDSETFNRENCVINMKNKQYLINVTYDTNYTDAELAAYRAFSVDYSMDVMLETTGWKTTQTSATDITSEKITLKTPASKNDAIRVYENYPDVHSWISLGYNIKDGLTSEKIEKLVNGESVDITCNIPIQYIWGLVHDEDELAVIEYDRMELKYFTDEKETKTIELEPSVMKLKDVFTQETTLGVINIYDSENNGEKIGTITQYGRYETGDKEIGAFKIGLQDFLDSKYKYINYTITYTLSGQKLKELGLSDYEIRNIMSLGNYAYVITSGEEPRGSKYVESAGAAYSYNNLTQAYEKSYMELDIGEQDTSIAELGKPKDVTMTLSMYNNAEVITNSKIKVVNVNPKIYIKLPDDFNYNNIKVSMQGDVNGKLSISNYKRQKIGNSYYIVIECDGTYTENFGKVDIIVNARRSERENEIGNSQEIKAYLITDNENYFEKSDVSAYGFEKNGTNISNAYAMNESFVVEESNSLKVNTQVSYNSQKPILNTGDILTINNPLKVQTNTTIKYIAEVRTYGDIISDINIINRIPLLSNKSIINPIDMESNFSLTNLKNIKVTVYKKRNCSTRRRIRW